MKAEPSAISESATTPPTVPPSSVPPSTVLPAPVSPAPTLLPSTTPPTISPPTSGPASNQAEEKKKEHGVGEEEEKKGVMVVSKSENDVRIAVIGNVDSGKSTLVGVLTRCLKDDGNGLARQLVFNYPHEKETGRTSSIGHEMMGFDEELKQVAPLRAKGSKNEMWTHITQNSSKFVTFIDLCGHQKYLKTTVFGLSGLMPDYAMIIVGANMGVSKMTKEHIGVTLALEVPFFVVVTKIDIAPPEVRKNTVQTLDKILHSIKRPGEYVKPDGDLPVYASLLKTNSICPIFSISNVTEEGVPQLKRFLSLLGSRITRNPLFRGPTDPVEFLVDDIFNVTGVGVVVAGTMLAGEASVNQILLLGPDDAGEFAPVVVRSIHYKRTLVSTAIAGQAACFAIRYHGAKKEQLKKSNVRKGMVIIDRTCNPKASWEFNAEVVILHHPTMIQRNYQAVIHCGVIRQTAEVFEMSKEYFKTGDKGTITFRFLYRPEYLHEGMALLFLEGRTKGLGKVASINREYKRAKPGVTKDKEERKQPSPRKKST